MKMKRVVARLAFAATTIVLLGSIALFAGSSLPNPLNTLDRTGFLGTYSSSGGLDFSGPYFQSLGTNGRSCNSCHVASQGWTVSPPEIQARFDATQGTDPIFRPVDGAVCPSADVSTIEARRSAYQLLLNKGLIRISVPVPAGANFQITNIVDPYNCPETTTSNPAMYRRPLPATNLRFLPTIMWDGREPSLESQATDAIMGHEQGAAPTAKQLQQIVGFESALYTAQSYDFTAGSLTAEGAAGGPVNLATVAFFVGINYSLSPGFNPAAFTDYSAWANLTGPSATPGREAIARGEALFNSLPIAITGVAGLNDKLGVSTVQGTCSTCHDTPNVGNHSLSVALNIGVTDYPGRPGLDISGLPVYTIECTVTGKTVQVTDPGRALISGKCADLGKTKGPILRGLAARAPYFHNGSAATLNNVVEFYNQRFNLNLTDQQKRDLVAFLRSL
jgi:cytochrome c peroxidase